MGRKPELLLEKVLVEVQSGLWLPKEELSDKQYKNYCIEMEKSRIKHGIRWAEVDSSYRDIL